MAQFSPLPGTFYRKPAPDKPAFKSEGETVEVGEVIGLIEVMKSFIEVHADISGKIVKFLVDSEEPVMAGQARRGDVNGFLRLLIANRGEIAVRIQRAARELGMTTIQAHSVADADSLAVKMADKAVSIGPPHAAKSYLNISAILAAADATGAQAIHPGYGFLSENAGFADAVEAAGLVFVGPKGETIRTMGDKAAARDRANEAGVPVLPGSEGRIADHSTARAVAAGSAIP